MGSPPAVRTHVTFKTPRFNQTEVKPHFINDCCFGEDCAAWLVESLQAAGWVEIEPAWQEDWGWQTGGKRGGRKFLISVGLIPEDSPEWLVVVEEHTGFLTRLRGAPGPSLMPDLTQAIHAILGASGEIREMRWHFADCFNRGTSEGAAEPSSPRGPHEVNGPSDR
jgi:hypothetical protein